MCNITFSFDSGHMGISPWDQSIWGCRLRVPYEDEVTGFGRLPSRDGVCFTGGCAGVDVPASGDAASRDEAEAADQDWTPVHMRVDQTPTPSETSHSVSHASYERSTLVQGKRPARDLLAWETLTIPYSSSSPTSTPTCLPGFHEIYETTPEGRDQMIKEGESPPNKEDPQWSCLMNPRYCCDQCAVGKYQPEMSKFQCLSCPHGFTNSKNGSDALGECCIPIDGIGLYNGGEQTFYNEFGINGSSHKIRAAYYFCDGKSSKHWPSNRAEGQSCTRNRDCRVGMWCGSRCDQNYFGCDESKWYTHTHTHTHKHTHTCV